MLGAPAGISDAFATRALHLPEHETGTLTDSIALACRDDMLASLWGEGPHASLTDDEPPAAWQLEARRGGLLFQLQGMPAGVWIWVNRAWCDANAPEPAGHTAGPLSDRRMAVAQSRLRVSAHIDVGQITLADSLAWSVGDVLLTDLPRLARVELSSNGAHVASGTLGQTGAHRHVSIA